MQKKEINSTVLESVDVFQEAHFSTYHAHLGKNANSCVLKIQHCPEFLLYSNTLHSTVLKLCRFTISTGIKMRTNVEHQGFQPRIEKIHYQKQQKLTQFFQKTLRSEQYRFCVVCFFLFKQLQLLIVRHSIYSILGLLHFKYHLLQKLL